ncbi:MAG: methyltransferase domain-containing protein [Patescibacteria group bacterium]|jgi:ubiquinone/menaquinone biosynthesis C-methylase UbiE
MLDAEFWQQYFKTYDILNIVIPYQELMEELIKESVVNKGDLVLDAGAGTGNLAVRLKQRGANVVALDNSEEGLRQLRVKDQEIGIIFHDLAKPLSFSDDYFDKIVSNNVIYTLAPGDRDKVFKEFYRILKPGGKIVISNVREGWNPVNIYKDHFKKDIKKIGFWCLILKVFKMIVPTVKMFYYNSKIKKNEGAGHLMKDNEQKELLIRNGFVEVSENKLVYAGQAILNSAIKPRDYESIKRDQLKNK